MNFRKAILDRDFDKAILLLQKSQIEDEKIIDVAFEDADLSYVDFYLYLIKKNGESAYCHWMLSNIWSVALCFEKDAYPKAYQHLKRAIELSPQNYLYRYEQLSFYYLPIEKQLISKPEILDILAQLLSMNVEDQTQSDSPHLKLQCLSD